MQPPTKKRKGLPTPLPVDGKVAVLQLAVQACRLRLHIPHSARTYTHQSVRSALPVDIADKIMAICDRMDQEERVWTIVEDLKKRPLMMTQWIQEHPEGWTYLPAFDLSRIAQPVRNLYLSSITPQACPGTLPNESMMRHMQGTFAKILLAVSESAEGALRDDPKQKALTTQKLEAESIRRSRRTFSEFRLELLTADSRLRRLPLSIRAPIVYRRWVTRRHWHVTWVR